MPSVDAKSDLLDDDMASWFGDPGRLSVQRAISELRAGRPVNVQYAGADGLIVAAAEMLGGEKIVSIAMRSEPAPGLVFPEPRMRHFRSLTAGSSHIALEGLSVDDIDAMLFAVSPSLPPVAQRPANSQEIVALKLVKLAYLLPAALVFPSAGHIQHTAISVDAQAVSDFHERSAHELTIATRARVPLAEAVDAEFVVFRGGDGLREQIAIIVGQPDPARAVLTRLHSACLTGDLFASLKCDCGDQLRLAIAEIADAGGGVLLYLDQEGRGIGFVNKMRAYGLQELGHDTLAADAVLGYGPDERRYAVASAMLRLLGIQKIVLMTNNPDKLNALESYGIVVTGHRRLIGDVNPHNLKYLTTKAHRAGHLLGEVVRRGLTSPS